MNIHNSLSILFLNIANFLKNNLNISQITLSSFPSAILSLTQISQSSCITQYLENQLSNYTNYQVSIIRPQVFYSCTALTSVNFPACTSIGSRAFQGCTALTSVNFPACTKIGDYAFASCTALTSINFPARTTIYSNAFWSCFNLISLYLPNSSVCTLNDYKAFSSTPISNYSNIAGRYGSIFVPRSLVATYKRATNWSRFSNRIFAIEDYPPPSE